MSTAHNYLAIDLGASSGRAVLGSFDGQRLTLRELHRFNNGPVELPTGLHWDAGRLLNEIKHSLTLAAQSGTPLSGIGIDTWGVDYGLLDQSGTLLSDPHHYRDPRTRTMMDAAFARVSRDRIYARTGIQFMPLNTLYQLLADLHAPGHPLKRAARLLFIPDLLNYWLTGIARTEPTIASTSQLYDTGSHIWAEDLIEALAIPAHILPEVAPPCTPIGPLLPALARDTGAGPITVFSIGSHDTASAVAAVPALGDSATDGWAYISSGTWSLVGRELLAPIRSPQAMLANFTNECGIEGTIRFHKNIAGLWLLQECQRVWAGQGRRYTFDQLVTIALASPPFASLIDPDHPPFAEFGDMPARIRDYCARAGEPVPDSDGALVRCILESLAIKSRIVIDLLETLTTPVKTIHIVGGGAQNHLLCQFTASATARPVLAGPIEATAAGNIMSQVLATRGVTSLAHIRAVIAASLPPTRYEPQAPEAWATALGRFRVLPNL